MPRVLVRFLTLLAAVAALLAAPAARAQSEGPPLADSVRELQAEIHALRLEMQQVREEMARTRTEEEQLRQEVQAYRSRTVGVPDVATPVAASAAAPLEQRVEKLEDDQQLLNAKVNDQYQTKVESASKYRVRLSGIALFDLFNNRGVVNNQDLPSWALPAGPLDGSGNIGATLRQSQIGLEVFGPQLLGARSSASIQADFAGGFPQTSNGVNFGIFRIRTAVGRLDWGKTSVVAGQDTLFFSPGNPTSFASLALPALSYSGNLWTWTPQVRVEHRIDVGEKSNFVLQGGILDPLTGEQPVDPYVRAPQAGELSRAPALAARVAWNHTVFGQQFTIGAGGYYSRQFYGFGRKLNGWAGMTDWNLPLTSRVSVSGKFYRGDAIGGLGGAIGRTALMSGPLSDPATSVSPVASLGGWGQVKFKASEKLEFNASYGQDNPFGRSIRNFFGNNPANFDFTLLTLNRTELTNVIYRPRSNLVFSAEFKHMRTFSIFGDDWTANQLNLVMGVLF